MSELVKITTHADDAVDRLPEQYREKPKLSALVRAYGTQAQALEDVFYEMIEANNLFDAVGAELDQIGDIVVQPREGRSDQRYLVRILAKIGQNVSKGTGPELIRIFKLLMQATRVYFNPLYPAGFSITAIGYDPVGTSVEVHAAMDLSRMGGVGIDFIAVAPAVGSFSFFGDPDPDGEGFGDYNDPEVGGTLASIF